METDAGKVTRFGYNHTTCGNVKDDWIAEVPVTGDQTVDPHALLRTQKSERVQKNAMQQRRNLEVLYFR